MSVKKKVGGKRRTIVVGRAQKTFAAGTSKVVRISLNPPGKRLLARSHKLRVTLVVFLRTQKVATRTLTFTSKMH
jgi:hypothetical protein